MEISPDLPDRVLVDPTRTRQILLNLLANAVKFTASGSVRLTVNKVMRGSDPYLSFAIADTGIGIAPDKLPKLFDRFLQADSSTTRRFGGTGLGLAISKGLIQLLGGALEVSSRLGVGSTFTFTLPLLAAAIGAAPAAPTGSQALQSGPSRRILLAEDNSMNQEIISVMLRQAGHEVAVVGDGLQAVTRAGENPGAFDLILMDIQMPVMDGCEAAMLLRDRACRLPIVALTANAMSDEIERCLRSGMDTHLAKPIAWPQLFAAIDRLTRNGHPHVQYRDRAQSIEPI